MLPIVRLTSLVTFVNVIVTLLSAPVVIVAPVPFNPKEAIYAFTSSKLSSVTPASCNNSSSVMSTETLVNATGAFVADIAFIVVLSPFLMLL